MSKFIRSMVYVLALLAGFTGARAATSGYTLLVAPARYSVMQVAFDVVGRDPAVLVSYQGEGSTSEPLLHAWNGQEWVHISLQDLREVSFVEKMPARTVLVGDDKTLPSVLADAVTWSPEVTRIYTLTTSSLVNEFGRIFKWSGSEWRWFAHRYNLDLEDESEPMRKSSWYDQPGPLYRPPLIDAIKMKHREPPPEPEPAPILDGGSPSAAPEIGADVAPAAGEDTKPAAWSAPNPVESESTPAN